MNQYIIQTVVGLAGGWLGNMLKKNGLGTIGNLVAGAAGGNILPMILGAMGMMGANAAATGDTSSPNMIATVLSSLVGGSAGSLIGGLFKKA